jgi:Ala-tRNA(Pro) deacylase
MAIARSLQAFLDNHGITYEVVQHPRSLTAMEAAAAAHVPGDRLAKSVLLEDENGYLMAVLPSTRRIDLGVLRMRLRRYLGLAVEDEVGALFYDCDRGAIPAAGTAYGVRTIIDDTLLEQPEVYFEAGDHEALVHVTNAQFNALMTGADHDRFTHHV